jgi:hypothetical protein
MAIPEQVRKQSEAVQELYKQLNEDDGTSINAEAVEDVVEPAGDTLSADENDNEQPARVPEDEQTTGATNQEDENSETYAQRWRSLQGSYNATVRQKSELEDRVVQMEQLLAALSEKSSTPNAVQEPVQVQRFVSDDDISEYGESIDVMRNVSREELVPVAQRLAQIESMLQQMQANVVPQVRAVAQRQHASAEQQFWSDLTTFVPQWREVNDNPDFQSWLLDVDPLTGAARQTFLDEAQRSLDANRVSAFFQTWLDTSGQVFVPQSTPAAANELEKQVAPGRSRGSGSPTSKAPKTYSPDDIKEFFNAVRLGKYKGREPERDRIERDIFAAQREGRITANA